MAKTKISEYDATASNNTDINSVNIAEGCAPSGINNAIRETMAALKRFQTGADGDPLTVGSNLVVTGNATLGDASGDSVTINGTIAPGIVISGSSSGDALRITQTGSGNALVVEDSTNPDSTPVIVNQNGRLILGDTSENNLLVGSKIQVSGTGGDAFIQAARFNSAATGNDPGFILGRSYGTSFSSRSAVVADAALGSITFAGDDGTNWVQGAKIQALVDGTPGTNDMPGRLVFSTTADGASSPTERMRIDSSGNVAIGANTTYGSRFFAAQGSAQSPSTSGNMSTGFILGSGVGGEGLNIGTDASGVWYNSAYTNNAGVPRIHRWLTGGTERMRIDSSGNLLFAGTTANTSGAGTWFEVPSDTTMPFYLRFKKTFSGIREAVDFRHSGTQVGRITFDNTSTAYATSSDYRLKENVAPMTGALAKVLELNPVTYTWKADGSASEGFIAHELQAICPDAVVGKKDETKIEQYEVTPAVYEDVVIPAVLDEDGNEIEPERTERQLVSEAVYEEREVPVYQGVDTSFLVATLTAAIQEQQAIIESLKSRLDAAGL